MSNKFTNRSIQKELLDESSIERSLLFKNLKELDFLNRRTGGHNISLHGLKKLITDKHKTYHVADLGCGSGDSLRYFADWARSNNYKVTFTGVDMNADAIDYLNLHCANYPEITGITADYNEYLASYVNIDIVHCSLFCHHLNDDELYRLFNYFRLHVKTGFIVNDLQRHWFAYYCSWLFTRLLNGSILSKNDGPISVLRGFHLAELVRMLDTARIRNYFIKKAWGFRILIVGKAGEYE